MIKQTLKKNPIVRRMRDQVLLAGSYLADWQRFRRSSGMRAGNSSGLQARIVMDGHRLEKGLALPTPKPWFGRDVVDRLLGNLERYLESAEVDGSERQYIMDLALGALTAYFEYFGADSAQQPGWVKSAGARTSHLCEGHTFGDDEGHGGIEPIGLHALDTGEGAPHTFEKFVRSRHSIRNFDTAIPDENVLYAAIRLAGTSPSVCNRQGSRVRIFPRGEEASKVLDHQNGNRGFGHTASHILLITQDLDSYVSPGERNQAFVDGGMFAMTLVYGLHAAGLGSCPLNWSMARPEDKKLRRDISLPEREVVVMMLAVGYPSEGIVVTRSPARPSIVLQSQER